MKLIPLSLCAVLFFSCSKNHNAVQTKTFTSLQISYALQFAVRSLTDGYLPQDLGINSNAVLMAENETEALAEYKKALDILFARDELTLRMRTFFVAQLYGDITGPFLPRRAGEMAAAIFKDRLSMDQIFLSQDTVADDGTWTDYGAADYPSVDLTPRGKRAGVLSDPYVAKKLNATLSHFPAVRDHLKWALCKLVSEEYPNFQRWEAQKLANPWKTGAGCPTCHSLMQPLRGAYHHYGVNGEWIDTVAEAETWGSSPGQAAEPHDSNGNTLPNRLDHYVIFEGKPPVLDPYTLSTQLLEQYPDDVDRCMVSRLANIALGIVTETAGEQWVQPHLFRTNVESENYIRKAVDLYRLKEKIGPDFLKEFLLDKELYLTIVTSEISTEEP